MASKARVFVVGSKSNYAAVHPGNDLGVELGAALDKTGEMAVFAEHRSIIDCNRHMLETGCQCDVQFLLIPSSSTEACKMTAHRYVLISRSPVFMAMLTGPLAEEEDCIKITDITPDTFKALLRFMYTEEVDLNEDNVFGILYAAKKYFIGDLMSKSISFLESILSPSNVCSFMDNAFLVEEDCPNLLSECSLIVQRQTELVLRSESFLFMNRESLCRLLEMPKLSVPEIDLFLACELWAKRKCEEDQLAETPGNMRELLGRALYLIHFPVMEMAQFSKVTQSGLLSTEEENAVFRHLGRASTTPSSCPFPSTMRSYVTGCAIIHYPDGFVKHATSFSSLFQGLPQRSRWSMSFKCDHNAKLVEIGLLGSFRGTLTIKQGGTLKLEITTPSNAQNIKLGDDSPLLDGGAVFTITSESPFSYDGEYYSHARGKNAPIAASDHHSVGISVKEFTSLCFLDRLMFVPTDELQFVDDHYADDVAD